MKYLRIWWQKPRSYSEKKDERTISFLELFYDLIYVVIIAELAHTLSADISLNSLMEFGFLFLVVWWAWLNGAMYHDNHGNNDIRTRIFTFLQMFAVSAMAVFAHNAFGSGAIGFAISYSVFLLIITYLWWRSGYHDKEHRPLSYPYSVIYLIANALIVLSLFLDESFRLILWLASLSLMVTVPLILLILSRNKPKLRIQIERTSSVSSSMVERFGLFTIIVLGEVIVGVIQGVASHKNLDLQVGLEAGLGMLVAIGIWWLYFDTISMSTPRKGYPNQAGWLYLHLLLTIGITAIGAAILNIIDVADKNQNNAKFLLIGAVATAYISIALLLYTIKSAEEHRNIFKIARRATFAAALLSLFLLIFNMSNIWLLGLLSLVMLAPIFFAIRFWIKEQVANLQKNQ